MARNYVAFGSSYLNTNMWRARLGKKQHTSFYRARNEPGRRKRWEKDSIQSSLGVNKHIHHLKKTERKKNGKDNLWRSFFQILKSIYIDLYILFFFFSNWGCLFRKAAGKIYKKICESHLVRPSWTTHFVNKVVNKTSAPVYVYPVVAIAIWRKCAFGYFYQHFFSWWMVF